MSTSLSAFSCSVEGPVMMDALQPEVMFHYPQSPPSREDWEVFKEVIIEHYATMPLREVVTAMKQLYGFDATERMYKQRLPEWGIFKYMKAAQRRQTKTDQFGRQEDMGSASAPMSRSSSVRTYTTAVSHGEEDIPNLETSDLPANEACQDPATCSHKQCVRDFWGKLTQESDAGHISVPPLNIPAACPWSSSRTASVEQVLENVRQFAQSWTFPNIDLHRHVIPNADAQAAKITSEIIGHCSHKRSTSQCERCTWSEFDYGLAMLEDGMYDEAATSFELGCRLAKLLLSRPSKLFIRNLINAFGSARWEKFECFRHRILEYLAGMSTTILRGHHPITIILHNVACGNILTESAQPALEIMIDIYQGASHSADPDVLLIKRSLSVVLRRKQKFVKAKSILDAAIHDSSNYHGPQAKETRRCLRRLGHLYMQQSMWQEAQEVYLEILHTAPGKNKYQADWIPDEISVYTYHHLTQMAQEMGDKQMTRFWFSKELAAALKRWGPTGDYTAECLQLVYNDTPAGALKDAVDQYPDILTHLQGMPMNEKVVISKARWCAVRNLI